MYSAIESASPLNEFSCLVDMLLLGKGNLAFSPLTLPVSAPKLTVNSSSLEIERIAIVSALLNSSISY